MTTTENSTIEPTHEPALSKETSPQTAVEPAADVAGAVSNDGDQQADVAPHEPAAIGEEVPDGAQTDEPAADGSVHEAGDASSAAGDSAVARPAPVADEVLLASVDLARAALLEVTPADTVGDPVGHVAEDDHVLSLFFDSKLRGYPGWHWTVTLSRVGDAETVTVLETELMPGENALLAPEWVPWSERLADYQAGQEVAENEARALAEAAAVLDDSDDEDAEDDEDVFSILHAGDVDGVDVDEIDQDPGETDDDDDDDESDDDDDDDESDDDESDDDDEDDEDDDESGSEGLDRSY
ncbi:MAG TPA: DUF3027 domain-containing protein [Mycetocola sp.]|nr:DUF3027 domain-containing protein [Mycetocola sp.]